jgi:hypothetical protein
MFRKSALAGVLALSVAGCTQAQLDRAAGYQAQIASACAVAMSLAPIAGPYAVWIVGACQSEAMIARLALDPSSYAWLQELIAKARGLA